MQIFNARNDVEKLLLTLEDAFSNGQYSSKKWITDELINLNLNLGTVFICAGWYATIAQMLFDSKLQIEKIRSFDIDPMSTRISEILNKRLVIDNWKFKACTKDIHELNYTQCEYTVLRSNGTSITLNDSPNTIINSSCEHIENFSQWWESLPKKTLIIVQSNNGFNLEGHINCKETIDDFAKTTPMSNVLYQGERNLTKFTRFMRIGYI